MPTPTDRQNSGISMAEKHGAEKALNEAIHAIYTNVGPSPVLVGIREAMRLLDMREDVPHD